MTLTTNQALGEVDVIRTRVQQRGMCSNISATSHSWHRPIFARVIRLLPFLMTTLSYAQSYPVVAFIGAYCTPIIRAGLTTRNSGPVSRLPTPSPTQEDSGSAVEAGETCVRFLTPVLETRMSEDLFPNQAVLCVPRQSIDL